MGLLMDTYEDNRGSYDDDVYLVFFTRPFYLDAPPVRPRGINTVSCPECFLSLTKEELPEHVRTNHADQYVYLRLDGHIMRNGDVRQIEGGLHECHLQLLGSDHARVTLTVDGDAHTIDTVQGETDLLPYMPSKVVKAIQIRVNLPGREHAAADFELLSKPLSPFDRRPIEEAIEVLQHAVDRGIEPSWSRFRQDWIHNPNRNPLERRYLEGFYDYTFAAWLENQGNGEDSQRWLETAFRLLEPFNTSLARKVKSGSCCRIVAHVVGPA